MIEKKQGTGFLPDKWHDSMSLGTAVIDGVTVELGSQICDNLPKGSENFKFYHIVGQEKYDMRGCHQTYSFVAALYQVADTKTWAWGINVNQAYKKLLAKMHDANKGIIATISNNAKNKKR